MSESTSFEAQIEAMTLREQLRKITSDEFGGDRQAATLMWAAGVFEAEAGKWPDGSSAKLVTLEWAATFWTAYVLRVAEIDDSTWADTDALTMPARAERRHLRALSGGDA